MTAFHRYLSGEGPIPIEHYFGRLSEEFGGRLPSELFAESQRLPVGFLETLLEYRAYAAAKFANDADPKGWASSPMRALANEIEDLIALEELDPEHG